MLQPTGWHNLIHLSIECTSLQFYLWQDNPVYLICKTPVPEAIRPSSGSHTKGSYMDLFMIRSLSLSAFHVHSSILCVVRYKFCNPPCDRLLFNTVSKWIPHWRARFNFIALRKLGKFINHYLMLVILCDIGIHRCNKRCKCSEESVN